MLAVVFVASIAVMAVFKLATDQFLETGAQSWGTYSWVMVFVGVVATAASFLSSRRAVNKLTLDSNPHAVALVLKAVNHMVGNLMNQFQFVRQEIENDQGLSQEAAKLMDSAMDEAQSGLNVLNSVQDTADEKSYAQIYPK